MPAQLMDLKNVSLAPLAQPEEKLSPDEGVWVYDREAQKMRTAGPVEAQRGFT